MQLNGSIFNINPYSTSTPSDRIQYLGSKFRTLMSSMNSIEKSNAVKIRILSLMQYMTVIYYDKEIISNELDDISIKLANFLNDLFDVSVDNSLLKITKNDTQLLLYMSRHRYRILFDNTNEFTKSIISFLELLEIEIPINNNNILVNIKFELIGSLQMLQIDFDALYAIGFRNFVGKRPLYDNITLGDCADYRKVDFSGLNILSISPYCDICGALFTGATINYDEVKQCFENNQIKTDKQGVLWIKTFNSFDNNYLKKHLFLRLEEEISGFEFKQDIFDLSIPQSISDETCKQVRLLEAIFPKCSTCPVEFLIYWINKIDHSTFILNNDLRLRVFNVFTQNKDVLKNSVIANYFYSEIASDPNDNNWVIIN